MRTVSPELAGGDATGGRAAAAALTAVDAEGLATPAFVVDVATVRAALAELRRALPGVGLHYAYKACPLPVVAAALVEEGISFEIASVAELCALQRAGAAPEAVLFSNPIKAPDEIGAAFAAGVRHFCVDSAVEVAKVAERAPGTRVYVRLAVDDAASVFPLSAKFGVDAGGARELMLQARDAGLDPWGVTFHVGSQCMQASAWAVAIAETGALMRVLEKDDIRIDALDLGGGFPVRYGASTPSWAEIGTVIAGAVAEHLPYPVTLLAEPGRALVAEAACAVATVIGRAARRDGEWLYLDLGVFNGVMEALEDGAEVLPPVLAPESGGPLRSFAVAGPTCDQADTIATAVSLPGDIGVGDRVVLCTAGAYSLSYTGAFCGFEAPALAVLDTTT